MTDPARRAAEHQIVRDAAWKLLAFFGAGATHDHIPQIEAMLREAIAAHERETLAKVIAEANHRYEWSWELSNNGRDEFRRGEARVAKELGEFIERLRAALEEKK